jgi:hypothetical protein
MGATTRNAIIEPAAEATALYETDFHAWTQREADKLRAGRLSELDREHLAEEIESLGKAQYNELVSRLRVLLQHLLKWQYQPERRGRSWQLTIRTQRIELEDHLADNPSLKSRLDTALPRAYRLARLDAAQATGLAPEVFPETCLYNAVEILDQAWLPESND